MRRKLATILIGVALLAGLGAAAAPITAAVSAQCDGSPFAITRHVGEYYDPVTTFGTGNVGIRTLLRIPGPQSFTVCDTDSEGNDLTAAWIAIQPDASNTNHNGSAILQMGITVCNNTDPIGGSEPCNHNNNPRFFYAAAGCGSSHAVGFDLDQGVAARDSWHALQISWDPQTDKWDLKLDEDWNGTTNFVQLGTIDDDDPVVSCWLGNKATSLSGSNSLITIASGEQNDVGNSLGSGNCGPGSCPNGNSNMLIFADVDRKDAFGNWNDMISPTGSQATTCATNDLPWPSNPWFQCWNPANAGLATGSNMYISTQR